MIVCGLSLDVWSRDDNVWSVFSCLEQEVEMCGLSLAVWSRDDNLWSVFSCLEQSWQAAYGPTIPSVVKPACVLLPSVRLTIVGSPQDSAPCAAHHHGFPTGQCPQCGSPSRVPHRTVPSVRLTITGSPQDSH